MRDLTAILCLCIGVAAAWLVAAAFALILAFGAVTGAVAAACWRTFKALMRVAGDV